MARRLRSIYGHSAPSNDPSLSQKPHTAPYPYHNLISRSPPTLIDPRNPPLMPPPHYSIAPWARTLARLDGVHESSQKQTLAMPRPSRRRTPPPTTPANSESRKSPSPPPSLTRTRTSRPPSSAVTTSSLHLARITQPQPTRPTDPLRILPLHIVATILEHTAPTDVIALQRVSKTWRGILASEYIHTLALRWHFAHTAAAARVWRIHRSPQGERFPAAAVPAFRATTKVSIARTAATCSSRRRRTTSNTGRTVVSRSPPAKLAMAASTPDRTARLCACPSSPGPHVTLRSNKPGIDLLLHTRHLLPDAARPSRSHSAPRLHLTASHLVLITTVPAALFVIPLDGGPPHHIALPPIAGAGRTVQCSAGAGWRLATLAGAPVVLRAWVHPPVSWDVGGKGVVVQKAAGRIVGVVG
ncbi:hypothetical protein EDC01DRAFT_775442 [Geopyxis carbonaria]|nr:hypothetical protein EDC01DRAFT_775442 [Geopyxis carbonaria]